MILFVLAGFAASFLWAVGRIATDRLAAIQYLHWIPTIVVLAITIACASALLASNWRRCRRIMWLIAFAQAGVFFVQDFGFARTQSLAARESIVRIAHINPNWPGAQSPVIASHLATALTGAFGASGPDVIFLSEVGALLTSEVARLYCPKDAVAYTVGRFGILSRVPIVELTPLYDDSKSTAAVVRFGAWNGAPSWSALVVDVPSKPQLPRYALWAELRARIDGLAVAQTDMVIGDFNTARGGASLRAFAPQMREAFAVAGVGYGASFPRELPLWHIDQMLVGPRMEVVRYEVINTGYGKHCMQTAVIHIGQAVTAQPQ